ncbi:hypothetical protein X777_00699, partial [Ooceraea biroi]
RSAIYQEFRDCFQDNNRKILKLCNTRSLFHHSCVTRFLEGWDTIIYFLSEMVMSEKSKSGEYLLSIMKNVDTKAYFFFKYIFNLFNSFNAFFQAVETRIHLLHSQSVNFLLQVCKYFLTQEHLKSPINNIVFSVKENQKALHDITLGSDCDEYLHDLMVQGHIDTVTTVQENCLAFYVTAAQEIQKSTSMIYFYQN